MQSELERILQSTIPMELAHSIEQNEYEIEKLQTILSTKNNQVHNLHQKINEELFSTIEQNEKLRKAINLYQKGMSMWREWSKQFKKNVIVSCFDCLEAMMKQFDDLGKKMSQTMTPLQIPSPKKQVKQLSVQASDNEKDLLKREVEKLKNRIQFLEEQNRNLFHQLQGGEINLSCTSSLTSSIISQDPYSMIQQQVQNRFQNLVQQTYCGDIVENMKYGEGQCSYEGGFIYEGEFRKGRREGSGLMRYQSTIIYQGQWKNDVFEGKGIFYFVDQDVQKYSGWFKGGKIQGYGTMHYQNGRKVRSMWQNKRAIGGKLIEDMEGFSFTDKKQNSLDSEIRSIYT